MILSDEYLQRDYDERGKRLLLTCCVCQLEGWHVDETDYPEHKCILNVPSCNDPDHSVCDRCLDKLNGNCVYPFSKYPCSGEFFQSKLYSVECTQCCKQSKVKDPGKQWTCTFCSRNACGLCDETCCQCVTGGPRSYSRLFFRDGFPLRCNTVSREMIDEKISRCELPWHHVECPTCISPLFKTNACNDLFHCGKSSVCNWCSHSSFPWESGIPNDHWTKCHRWDVYLPWFECRDCDTEHQECKNSSHQQSIYKYHNERFHAFLELIRKEFPWYYISVK